MPHISEWWWGEDLKKKKEGETQKGKRSHLDGVPASKNLTSLAKVVEKLARTLS